MTITNSTRLVVAQGNDATTVWPFNFLVPTAGELRVTVFDGFANTILDPSDYSVTGINDPNGGAVTYPLAGSPLATGEQIIIERLVSFVQPTTFQNQQRFFPQVLEAALDRLTMQTQQLAEIQARTPALPPTAPQQDIDELFNAILVANQNIATILNVNSNLAAILAVEGELADINILAPIAAAISTVANINAAVIAVDANEANINAVAGNQADISAVAAIAGSVVIAASIDTEITNLSAVITELLAVENELAAVVTTAGVATEIAALAVIASDISTVAGNIAAVASVAAIDSAVVSVAQKYQGALSANPTVRTLDGSPVQVGDFYLNTGTNELRFLSSTGPNVWSQFTTLINESTLTALGVTVSAANINSLAGITGIASQAQAQAGTANDVLMTPLRTREAFNASGSAPVYACRAWVNFNGTGTVSIRASGNVTSITDNGTGDYTINFATAMQDANYAAVVSASRNDNNRRLAIADGFNTNNFTVRVGLGNSTTLGPEDAAQVCAAVFR
jgi:hypothetical protein